MRLTDSAGRYGAIALGVAIPVSVALDNVLLAVLLACWLAGGDYNRKLLIIKENISRIGAMVLFLVILAGTVYGEQSTRDARDHVLKYLDLAFVPIFAYFFRDARTRQLGLHALAATLAVVLLLSYLIKFGWIPPGRFFDGTPESPLVFKFRITHSLLMAVAAYLYYWMASVSTSAGARGLWTLLAVFAAANVLLLVEGATGYVVLAALAMLAACDRFGWRRALLALAALAALVVVLASVPGPFSTRVDAIRSEARAWTPGVPTQTSAGLRLEFYHNTLGIIADNPVLGVGTGGFAQAYAKQVAGTGMSATRNPHNEYLLVAAQTGIAGIAALLGLFWLQWRAAPRLPTPMERGLARGAVLAIAVGCLFNSLLLDHTEGLLYAWLTGLLYAGLPRAGAASGKAPS